VAVGGSGPLARAVSTVPPTLHNKSTVPPTLHQKNNTVRQEQHCAAHASPLAAAAHPPSRPPSGAEL